MFWKVYSGIVTIAAVTMYAHIRHVEGWVAGMKAHIIAEAANAETKPNDETADK